MWNSSEEEFVHIVDNNTSTLDILRKVSRREDQHHSFYVFDVEDVVKKHSEWMKKMPRVHPFYAVKCNENRLVLATLANLGAGFDCASKSEISKVLNLGVDPGRIIFSSPTKIASHISYAARKNVKMMTFDSECELQKVKELHPHANMVLRIRCEAKAAVILMGDKFGCDPVTEAPRLLQAAVTLGVKVVGVSFHVVTGCQESEAFRRAISAARHVCDVGNQIGHRMTLLDIGGGFPGKRDCPIDEVALVVAEALEDHFPSALGVRVVAEPGRYYVTSAFTLAAQVHSKRDTSYYINDGVFGSFDCVVTEKVQVSPFPLEDKTGVPEGSTLWGVTCHGLDRVAGNILLPPLDVGDWLVFEDMGAYTLSTASTFNGFPIPKVHYAINESVRDLLTKRLPEADESKKSNDNT